MSAFIEGQENDLLIVELLGIQDLDVQYGRVRSQLRSGALKPTGAAVYVRAGALTDAQEQAITAWAASKAGITDLSVIEIVQEA